MHLVSSSSREAACCAAELHVVRCNDLLAAGTGSLDMLSCVTSLRRLYVNGLPTLVDAEVRPLPHCSSPVFPVADLVKVLADGEAVG